MGSGVSRHSPRGAETTGSLGRSSQNCKREVGAPAAKKYRRTPRFSEPLALLVTLGDRAANDVRNVAALFLFFLEEGLILVGGHVGLAVLDIRQRLVGL